MTSASYVDNHLPRPALGNTYHNDRLLQELLQRYLNAEDRAALQDDLNRMGDLAGRSLYQQQLAEQTLEPVHVAWDAWGRRQDTVRLTPLWHRAHRLAAEFGLISRGYEEGAGNGRMAQFALSYLFIPSTDFYGCPLAMTDGAAAALTARAEDSLRQEIMPHLTSRDPQQFWTSGQWMTEINGGSHLSNSETYARLEGDGNWRLYGRKWFTSAITAEIALTLARPAGNPDGLRGLAMFLVHTHRQDGRLNDLSIIRLKDKLGTRKLPTAELLLEGSRGRLVGPIEGGISAIAPMLNITRTWNAVTASALMRRGVDLAVHYARQRRVGDEPLIGKPLHAATLGQVMAETRAACHLSFFLVNVLAEVEQGQTERAPLLRLLTSLVKLTTARQSISVLSEVLECFGGAGYLEDTGLPTLLRDAQVLSIWEGTTNVLALDARQVWQQDDDALDLLLTEIESRFAGTTLAALEGVCNQGQRSLERTRTWLREGCSEHQARDASISVTRLLALALMCEHAQWTADEEANQTTAVAAARQFAAYDLDRLQLIHLDPLHHLAQQG